MVGRDVLLRVEKHARKPGEPLLEVERPAGRATTAACPPCAASSLDVRARRDRRHSPASTATARAS